jgi:hypothetical protein
MVIKSNKGFGILVLPDVLTISIRAKTSLSDLTYGGGASSFSDPVVSSICIGSRHLVFLNFQLGHQPISSSFLSDRGHFETDQLSYAPFVSRVIPFSVPMLSLPL